MLCRSSRTIRSQSLQVSRSLTRRAGLSLYKQPPFKNEKALDYGKTSPERAAITKAYKDMKAKLPIDVPLVVGGKSIDVPTSIVQPNPSNHKQAVANYAHATKTEVKAAIDAAMEARPAWDAMSLNERAAIFLRAADLASGKYRYEFMASTMLGQGKNIWQAEIDAGGEAADLLRYYVAAAFELSAQQPLLNPEGMWNRLQYRGLEGFIYAISPFNFTALGANLVAGPALMGNVVLWKPSASALHSSWILYQILLEAGLPKNVIQFIPGDPDEVTDTVLESEHFAGLSFTGSTQVFKGLWGKIGKAVAEDKFLNYPRIVGETGGKNFHLIHETADIENAVNNTMRSAFEYQGQKCSASSRIYVAESIWPQVKESFVSKTNSIKVGDPEQYENFINPVIHEAAFDRLAGFIEKAKSDPELTLLAGGKASKETGYFVHPTIYQTSNPTNEVMTRELFGPLCAVYVYPDAEFSSILKTIDSSTKYALTGSIFAKDQSAINEAEKALKNSAGNFYINTKSSGAVIGQQPFGGSRGSGTNDKTGSVNFLNRFSSVRTIKEDFVGINDFLYPSNEV